MGRKAVVLLSGGMDSATTLAIAKKEEFEIYALSFDYGQRNSLEIKKAGEIAAFFGAKDHLVIPVYLKKIGGSSLTTDGMPLPKGRDIGEIGKEIPSTYVPARNTIFLSYALAWAEEKDEAEKYLILATELDPTDYRAFYSLGYVYRDTGRYPKAKEAWAKVLQLLPNFPEVENNMKSLKKYA